ncbi:hypothetical protein [uncultured Kordia sp.]|uniref:hypothetical protein n=1 Tax=uncultured Kordia sp. TaxID=507699 RepID=UPI00260C14D9|nr:hypothetical protein [uncultured Kordia sp.]
MKKKNVNLKLSLKKNRVSNLQSYGVTGGANVTKESPCPVKSERGPCYSEDCIVTGPSIVATCAAGCTRATIELSYCNNGIPNPCLSVQVCA